MQICHSLWPGYAAVLLSAPSLIPISHCGQKTSDDVPLALTDSRIFLTIIIRLDVIKTSTLNSYQAKIFANAIQHHIFIIIGDEIRPIPKHDKLAMQKVCTYSRADKFSATFVYLYALHNIPL